MALELFTTFLIWYAVYIPLVVSVLLIVGSYKKVNGLGAAKIVGTFLGWWYSYPPLMLVSCFAVPVMLAQGWEGYTTLFGNFKYGRYGNSAYPAHTRFQEWWFLCVRNPISNFGKETLSVSSTARWPWHYDVPLFWRLWIKAGWKEVKDPVKNPERTFVFRPYFKRGTP